MPAAIPVESSQNLLPKPQPKNKFWPILAFIFILGIGIGLFFNARTQKAEIKKLANEQGAEFEKTAKALGEINRLYREDKKPEDEKATQLLRAYKMPDPQSSDVLGLEDSPGIVMLRKSFEQIRDARTAIKHIEEGNKSIKEKYTGMTKFLIKGNLPLKETDEFIQKGDKIFKYLERASNHQLEVSTLAFDLGVKLDTAIKRVDETSINELEEKIAELKKLIEDEELSVKSEVPADLVSDYEKAQIEGKKMIAKFEELIPTLKRQDAATFLRLIEDIVVLSEVETEKGNTTILTFLQNNVTLRSIVELQKSWGKVAAEN